MGKHDRTGQRAPQRPSRRPAPAHSAHADNVQSHSRTRTLRLRSFAREALFRRTRALFFRSIQAPVVV